MHAGIVDVILNIDFPACETQQADERIAENGIAQVSNVRGLVWIDAGVLDQNFAGRNLGLRSFIGGERGSKLFALDSCVDVASTCEFEPLKVINRPDAGDNLFRNLSGRLAQLLGQLKSKWQCIFAKLDPRRLLDDDLG